MAFFDQAGKYAGLSGFPTGFTLGENLTKPLNQQTNSASSPPSDLAAIYESYGPNIPEDLKKDLLRQEVLNRSSSKTADNSFLEKAFEIANDPVRRKELLDQQLAFDKARMKEAFPYLMAREIPRQISEGFANRAALTVLGARSGAEAMAQTLNAYPRVSLATVPFQPQKYFS
jgi:hypothetical protein